MNIENIEENVIERDLYEMETGIDAVMADMTYFRHNNPDMFQKYLINVKELVARANEIGTRLKFMNEYIKMEAVL